MLSSTNITLSSQLPQLVNSTSIQALSQIVNSTSTPFLPKPTNSILSTPTHTALEQLQDNDNSTTVDNISSLDKSIQRPKKIIIKAKILND